MSYARWGKDSNVYVYLDCSGFLLCACGDPAITGIGFKAYRTSDMIEHLKEHKGKGDTVPEYTLTGLTEDASENDAHIEELHKDCPRENCVYEKARLKW